VLKSVKLSIGDKWPAFVAHINDQAKEEVQSQAEAADGVSIDF
jgi:hypothetical protein